MVRCLCARVSPYIRQCVVYVFLAKLYVCVEIKIKHFILIFVICCFPETFVGCLLGPSGVRFYNKVGSATPPTFSFKMWAELPIQLVIESEPRCKINCLVGIRILLMNKQFTLTPPCNIDARTCRNSPHFPHARSQMLLEKCLLVKD